MTDYVRNNCIYVISMMKVYVGVIKDYTTASVVCAFSWWIKRK